MAINIVRNATLSMYPQGRVGPTGEIGTWAFLHSVAGDGSGGELVVDLVLLDFNRALAYDLVKASVVHLDATSRRYQFFFITGMPGGEGAIHDVNWKFEPTVTATARCALADDEQARLPGPISPVAGDPNAEWRTSNVNGLIFGFSAYGRIYTHMLRQQV